MLTIRIARLIAKAHTSCKQIPMSPDGQAHRHKHEDTAMQATFLVSRSCMANGIIA